MEDPMVVIVGGGFAGLSAAKALRKAPVRVVLIDRTNHHLFQPLLYQVATSVLSPAQVAAPIREILSEQQNTTVLLGEVRGVDTEKKCVLVDARDRKGVPITYDYLILATGATHSYFGHPEFEKYAPGLKSLPDALALRNKILRAFEQAETEEDARAHPDLLTFVLVGGGPAGVEMAGAIADLVHKSLRTQFRRIDPTSARIVLVDAGHKLLNAYDDKLSQGAKEQLEKLGVEVRLGHPVEQIDADGVTVAGERIDSKTVIWTAGVAPSPAGKWLNAETDHAGRVWINPDLTVSGHPEIFVAGDTASLRQEGTPLGVAQVAIQQGSYAAHVIQLRATGKPAPGPFRYFDKGTMAVVGPGYAVLQSGKIHLRGLLAWIPWALIHIFSLAQVGLRISVFAQWAWTFFTGERGSRLIVDYRVPSQQTTQEAPLDASSARKTAP
jgi:NADH dehydrogenase FAD-containing subunit